MLKVTYRDIPISTLMNIFAALVAFVELAAAIVGSAYCCHGVCHDTSTPLVVSKFPLQNLCVNISQGNYPDIYSAQEKWQEAGQKFRVFLIDWHLKFHLTCIV